MDLNLDNTEELEVNTTRRWTKNCRNVSADGTKVCSLYAPHDGLCKPKHGIDKDLFEGIPPEPKTFHFKDSE